MLARFTTLRGEPDRIDATLRFVRESVQPLVLDQPRNAGLGAWVAHDGDEISVASFWRDAEALRTSDAAMRDVRAQAGEITGTRPQIQVLEVLLDDKAVRQEVGQSVRALRLSRDVRRRQEQLTWFREVAVPTLRGFEGYVGVVLYAAPEGPEAMVTTVYRDRPSLERGVEAAAGLRAHAPAIGMELREATSYQCALLARPAPSSPHVVDLTERERTHH